MSDYLFLLLSIYAVTLVLNLVIAFLQTRERRSTGIHNITLYLWAVVLAEFVLQRFSMRMDLLNILCLSLNVLTGYWLSRFARATMGLDHRPRRILGVFVAALGVTLALWTAGAGFVAYGTPVAFAVAYPLFSIFVQGARGDCWSRRTFLEKLFLVTSLGMALNFVDYPFLRPNPTGSLIGFSLMYVMFHVCSVLIPLMTNEKAYREYNSRLENEVRKQSELLVAAGKMAALGEMAGGVAHEVNTPLTVICLTAKRLRKSQAEGALDPRFLVRHLEVIESTANRIARIVAGLRAFSRDAQGDGMEVVAVRDIIEETLPFCHERFRNHGIRLTVEQADPGLRLLCRRVQLSQVLLNLLNNAFDAVARLEERWVRIEVSRRAETVRIDVVDSGKGIPEGVRERLFQPFFSTKPIGRGTGLGLSVSTGIVQAHGGVLELDPGSPHTRFVVRLPLSEGPAQVELGKRSANG